MGNFFIKMNVYKEKDEKHSFSVHKSNKVCSNYSRQSENFVENILLTVIKKYCYNLNFI